MNATIETNKITGEIQTENTLNGKLNTDSLGKNGQDGATFIPSVSEDGIISWTNNKNLPNPEPVDIRGPIGPTYTLTDTDRNTIVNAVINTLPTWEGGIF